MKKTKLIVLGALVVFLAACGTNPDNKGSSTPIDSTNLTGEAPAQYGPTNPADPEPPRYEGANDTGLRVNTASSEDSKRLNK